MREDDVQLFRCLECGGALEATAVRTVGSVMESALLHCPTCAAAYPVVEGVAVFFPRELQGVYLGATEREFLGRNGIDVGTAPTLSGGAKAQHAAAANWEYQWQTVQPFTAADLTRNPDDFYGENTFWRFIPLPREAVRGKTVFIGGGGRGREAFHLWNAGAARLIVNEIGAEIYAIRDLFPDALERIVLVRGDLCRLPLVSHCADIAICDHALQHVLDHRKGYQELSRLTRPGGMVAVCVYSHEGNFVMTRVIEPSKQLLHRLPLRAQRILALGPAGLLFLHIHLLVVPLAHLSPRLARALPLGPFLLFWAKAKFAFVWMSCFDFIHAPISYHFHRAEMEALATSCSHVIEALQHTHRTLWSMVVRKPAPSESRAAAG
ncbi:MAG TPA: methyltransferase domain-containing protein [Candidatus Krumholzibacteria bacterium]|nr:methyltransferase domain-containing protein [Candidatus Krumholzibacteria bacterium]